MNVNVARERKGYPPPATPRSRFTLTLHVFFIIALTLGVCWPAGAAKGGEPTRLLKRRDALVKKILPPKGKELTEKQRKRLKDLHQDIIDFPAMARRSLKKHWEGLTPEQRQEFMTLFTDLEKNSLVEKLDRYRADKLVYKGEQIDGEKAKVLVKARAKREWVEIEYRLHRKDDRWMIYDLVHDDVSTIANFRSQFNRQIKKSGFDGLLEKMRKKRDKS